MKNNSFSKVQFESTEIHPILREYFGYCFSKAGIRHKSLIYAAFANHNLVPPQLGILKLLSVMGPVSQISIGQELVMDKASMVKYIDGLEEIKLVKRIPSTSDRRIKLVAITDKGRKSMDKFTQIIHDVEDEFLSALTVTERNQLKALIRKIV